MEERVDLDQRIFSDVGLTEVVWHMTWYAEFLDAFVQDDTAELHRHDPRYYASYGQDYEDAVAVATAITASPGGSSGIKQRNVVQVTTWRHLHFLSNWIWICWWIWLSIFCHGQPIWQHYQRSLGLLGNLVTLGCSKLRIGNSKF